MWKTPIDNIIKEPDVPMTKSVAGIDPLIIVVVATVTVAAAALLLRRRS